MLIKKITMYMLMSISLIMSTSYAKSNIENKKEISPNKIIKINFLYANKSLDLYNLSLKDITFLSSKKDIEVENRVFEDGFVEVRINLKGDYKLKAYNKLIISKNKEVFIAGIPFGVNRNALIDNTGKVEFGSFINHDSFGVKPPPPQ